MAERPINNPDDIQLLSLYIDGELDAVAIDRLETRLEREPQLRAQLDTLQKNDALLCQLYKSGPATRIPAKATVALSSTDNVVVFPARRKARLPFAIAATVVMGIAAVLVQQNLMTGAGRAPGMDQRLADALETLPSRADGWDTLADGSQLRAVLTFPAADGRWCREFMLANDEKHWRGVACRDNDTWVTQVMGSEVFLEQQTHYRTAGAEDDLAVARFIDNTAADVALGPAQEQQLIDAGWQAP